MSETITVTEPAGDRHNRVEPTLAREYAEITAHHKGEATAAKAARTTAERERDEAKAAVVAATAERDAKVTEAVAKANERMIRAELRRAATAAGLHDARDIADVDVSKLKLTDADTVEGLDAYVTALKSERPHLFKSSTGSTATTPEPGSAAKSATEMTSDEYRAARAAAIKKR